MTRGDQLIVRAADRLDAFARRAAADGGFKAKLAEPLAEDASLLRGMRPSLIAARLRGDGAVPEAAEPRPPEPEPARARERPGQGGPSPLVLAAAALVVGLVVARLIDWRSHAYPRG